MKRPRGTPAAAVLSGGIRGWRPEFRRVDRVQVGDRIRLLSSGALAFDVTAVSRRGSILGELVALTAADGASYEMLGEQLVEVSS